MLFTPLAEKWHSCNHNQHLDDATANNAPTLVRMPGQPATQQNTLQATHTCRASAVSWMTHVPPCCVQAARITALPQWKLFFLPHILQLCTSAGQQDAALFFSAPCTVPSANMYHLSGRSSEPLSRGVRLTTLPKPSSCACRRSSRPLRAQPTHLLYCSKCSLLRPQS